MTLNCNPNATIVPPTPPTERVKWTPTTKTRLGKLAQQRSVAQQAIRAMYTEVDPIAAKIAASSARSQEYWEQAVFETGTIAFLNPAQSARASQWMANWLGQKMGVAGAVRNPLLNIKRLGDGLLREVGVYTLMDKQRKLASFLKAKASQRGVEVRPEDMRRILEEGMIPQRLNIYGNTEMQQEALMDSFTKFHTDFVDRGFTPDDITELLDVAQGVSSVWDEFMAVQKAMGLDVGTMFNLGYMPRQLTDDGFMLAKLHGAIKFEDATDVGVALINSRNTWRYLAEDHNMAAKLLDVPVDELHKLISTPSEFATFLSKKVTDDQLDLLVDSGILSKIPALTTDVAEFVTKSYGIPLTSSELFITDPLKATQSLISRLKYGVEQSAMVKLIRTEGFKKGWAITEVVKESSPQFVNYTKLNEVPGLTVGGEGLYVHPVVANQLAALIEISTNPAQLSNASKAWHVFTNWFSKQAIGNPITAKAYLAGQFIGNMLAVFGRASIIDYFTSVVDMTKLAMVGLEGFDNELPKYIIDGVPITHREVVARTARMFSRNVLPGLSGDDAILNLEELNPTYFMKQLGMLQASAQSLPEYMGELGKVLNKKQDAVLLPSIRVASILDMAAHLAIIKGKAPQVGGLGAQALDAANQLMLGWNVGKIDTWEGLVKEVKTAMPVFDDPGKLPEFMMRVFPFSAWAMQNAPLQIRDMLRNPTRWYAYSRAIALWNEDREWEGGDKILRGELSQRDANEYGILLQRDSNTKTTTMLMPSQFDPRWGTLTWMVNMLDNSPQTAKIRGDVASNNVQDWMNDVMNRSYFKGAYEAISGFDTYTGRKRDASSFNATNQFLGISMPTWLSSIMGMSPILQSVDRLPMISGTRAVTDPRTAEVLIPAVQGWLGNQGKLPPNRLTGVEATMQTLGARVRFIDGMANMQLTEGDTKKAIRELLMRKRREQIDLANAVRGGTIKLNSPEYVRRVDAINRMTDAVIQLNYDLGRIQLWGVENGVPSSEALNEFRKRGLAMDAAPLPGSDYIKETLDRAMQEKMSGGSQ